jgi:WXG100 family type VII secretion target
MSFLGDIEGIFDPGGDPAAIRAAATACRTLASELDGVTSALDSVAADLEKSWKGVAGAEDQSASATFQKAWSKFSTAIGEYAQSLDGAAAKLDNVADAIQSADEEAARLKEMALAALAVGAGLTLFTFGISDATAEAAAMADVAVATGEMSELAAALSFVADAFGDLLGTIGDIATRFAMGSGFSLVAEMLDKLVFLHENPLDPANYSAEDVANIILGGMLNAGMGVAADSSEPVSQFMGAHPVAGFAAYGAATGFVGGAVTQFAIEGKPLDAGTIEDIGVGTVLSGIGGAAAGKVSELIGGTSGGSAGTGDGPPVTVPALSLPGALDNLEVPASDLAAPDQSAPSAASPTEAGGDAAGVTAPPDAAPAAPVAGGSGDPVPGAPVAGGTGSPAPAPVAGGSGDPAPAAPVAGGSGDPAPAPAAPPEANLSGPPAVTGPAAQVPAPDPPAVVRADAGDGGAAGSGPAAAAQAGPEPIAPAPGSGVSTSGGGGSPVIRSGVNVLPNIVKDRLFFSPSPAPTAPHAPAAPPAVPVPHVSPPQIGGGTVTVRPGQSLYQIAGQQLGNPNLYPLIQAANPHAVGPDGGIVPGQVLHIPQLPRLPPGSTAQVVQPGESVWEIAGGDPALAGRIAELNHLEDPALIQPGQVLIIPPAA